MFNGLDMVLEAVNDAVVGLDVVVVVIDLEGFDEEDVAFTVVGKNDIFVAAAGADMESTHVVILQLANWKDAEMDFVGADVGYRDGNRVGRSRKRRRLIFGFRIGGTDALMGMGHVAFYGFVWLRPVIGVSVICEAGPGAVVAGFYFSNQVESTGNPEAA